jgi:uncharacterized protein YndB with AHSA1/START domain
MTERTDTAVRKSISVRAGVERAFQAFTEGIDDWWPRSHHVGNAPAKKGFIEGHAGGRCYTEHTDGSETDWGKVLIWEPPARFVMAWLINGNWKCDPDLSKASEVEVRFTRQPDGTTRVDLEHRNFERMGESGMNMRMVVDSAPGGWGGLLQLYAAYVQKGEGE